MIDFDTVQVGDVLPELQIPISRADLVRYAGASGDFNPIHWNERFAQGVGLPDVIAHGMYTMALTGRVLTEWMGAGGEVRDYGVRFTRPVVVSDAQGAILTASAIVKTKAADGALGIEFSAVVDGQTVLARARAVIKPRGGSSGSGSA